ncbi:chorismate lyase [Rosenbergiella epipactidis]|uniref:chorismate lyase n=1 Tax=Rosenbergiella epipactidis TaxID=1544694 RepID=UPI001BDA3C5E|nr:chorismate lyase [Rosenbergiella epipactidis]MBT0719320.1 chorismate lyase [Rosenbergiella epipactidis]
MHDLSVQRLLTDQFRALNESDCAPDIYSWLVDETSMTARLEAYCQKLEVTIVKEGFFSEHALTPDEHQLVVGDAENTRFWLREVQLLADGEPWLAGRTVIPESSLQGPEASLMALGTRPLGHYLFQSSSLCRDFLTPGTMNGLWARRSLLRLANKPLLLTEIFLPASPLYPLLAKGSLPCILQPLQK